MLVIPHFHRLNSVAAYSVLCAVLIVSACASSVTPSASQPVSVEAVDMINPATSTKYAEPGPFNFRITQDVWQDIERDRAINVKLYVPEGADAPPVVIFSHGLGGSVDAAPYLGQRLASWGILAVHIQHPGSDREVWRGTRGRAAIMGKLRRAARDPQNSIDRFNDLPFVIDQIELRAAAGTLNADPSRVGMAGHSFGAHSVLAAAGRTYPENLAAGSFKDERVLAAVVLSPPPPGARDHQALYEAIYGPIDRPLLHITGTEDMSPLDRSRTAEEREIPYGNITNASQYLIVFDDANHAVFGGAQRAGFSPNERVIQSRVAEIGSGFFYAYLFGDEDALAYLNGDGFLEDFSVDARSDRRLVD